MCWPEQEGAGWGGGQARLRVHICGQACSQSSDPAIHMRTHTGDHPYSCTSCSQALSDSINLTTHEPTHTGDRPIAPKLQAYYRVLGRSMCVCGFGGGQFGDSTLDEAS